MHLKDFVKPHFVVAGEVNHPGTSDLRGQVTTIQAIAMSGGFQGKLQTVQSDSAPADPNEDYAEVKILDLKKLMSPSNIRRVSRCAPMTCWLCPRTRSVNSSRWVRVGSMGLYGLALAFH